MPTPEPQQPSWENLLGRSGVDVHWPEIDARIRLLADKVVAAWGRTQLTTDDLVAECEYKLFTHLSSFRQGISCCPNPETQERYIVSFVSRTAIDLWRRDLGRRASASGVLLDIHPAPSSEAQTDAEHRVEELLQLIDGPSRSLLRLRFIEGLDLKEIATTLGITYASAATRIHRALNELRQQAVRSTQDG